MKTPVLFLIAILTPVLLCSTLLVPAFAGMFAADYLVYMPSSGPHPMADKWMDPFMIYDTYGVLLDYWFKNRASLDFVEHTLPIFGAPLAGAILSLWLTYALGKRLFNLFHLSASIN